MIFEKFSEAEDSCEDDVMVVDCAKQLAASVQTSRSRRMLQQKGQGLRAGEMVHVHGIKVYCGAHIFPHILNLCPR